ncbi:MAG: YncE family protein [candidate division WOR-3 bacterium]|nr:YncE family protein [candidate division WOR-3 bacterium]
MRIASVLLAACCCLSAVSAQWLETTILIPDSLAGVTYPRRLALNPVENTIYVSGLGGLIAIDGNTNAKLARIGLPYEQTGIGLDIACNPSANKAYCASVFDSSVVVVDGATNQRTATVPVARYPIALAYDADDNRVYCAHWFSPVVTVIDCTGDSVLTTTPIGAGSSDICYHPGAGKVYCTDGYAVTVIDCGPDTVIGTIPVGGMPSALCLNPQENKVYAANYDSGTVSVIDCASDSVVKVVSTGTEPLFLSRSVHKFANVFFS